jgi:hypothetical protein
MIDHMAEMAGRLKADTIHKVSQTADFGREASGGVNVKVLYFISSLICLALGCLGTLGFFGSFLLQSPPDSIGPLLGFAAWNLFPYGVAAALVWLARKNTIAGALGLIGCLLLLLIGVGLPVKVFYFDPPDAQSALVILVTPVYQFLGAAPFLIPAQILARTKKPLPPDAP